MPTGKKPDLWLSRNGIDYLIEVTALGFDRELRDVEAWTQTVFAALRMYESRSQVRIACHLDEKLEAEPTRQWLDDIEQAARLTCQDGLRRTIAIGLNTVVVAQDGEPIDTGWSGPMQTQDVWARVATRIQQKANQTSGGPPAWLRIDDVGALFHLTDWSGRSLDVRLDQLVNNVGVCLADAPHVHGVILSGAVQYASDGALGQTAWLKAGQLIGVPDRAPPRQRLAEGPAALRRMLPQNQQRLTFIIPTLHNRILLPPGTGLEPGLWYDEEPAWLNRALRQLGKPSLQTIMQ